jgi:hypothetical protein
MVVNKVAVTTIVLPDGVLKDLERRARLEAKSLEAYL